MTFTQNNILNNALKIAKSYLSPKWDNANDNERLRKYEKEIGYCIKNNIYFADDGKNKKNMVKCIHDIKEIS